MPNLAPLLPFLVAFAVVGFDDEPAWSANYVVPLAHDPATGIGWDETPHALDDAVLWTERCLVAVTTCADEGVGSV